MAGKGPYLLGSGDIALGRQCLALALEKGASKARVSLGGNRMDLVATRDGAVDRVLHSLDRALTLNVFADGRYASFSTNRFDGKSLEDFVARAVETTRMLAPDPCRDLPPQKRVEKGAVTGLETGLYDPSVEKMTPARRIKAALGAAISAPVLPAGMRLLSEEGEYSDSLSDSVVMDSQGTFCRHIETSFDYGVEVTIADATGTRCSGYWWDSAPYLKDLHSDICGRTALERAVAQAGPVPKDNCSCPLVVDSEVAGRLVTPLLNALSAYSIQQHNSFLEDSLGKKTFSKGLTIIDECRIPGKSGSRLFDSEGVATRERTIIGKGVVRQYFVNTYMAAKTGLAPTVEEAIRPRIPGWPREGLTRDDLLSLCGSGIFVTGFNGGNFNPVTGDFSYGIEGFVFENGVLGRPVSEMLMTGNLITLWQGLIAAASDARPCMSKIIPTLAFSKVDFSG